MRATPSSGELEKRDSHLGNANANASSATSSGVVFAFEPLQRRESRMQHEIDDICKTSVRFRLLFVSLT